MNKQEFIIKLQEEEKQILKNYHSLKEDGETRSLSIEPQDICEKVFPQQKWQESKVQLQREIEAALEVSLDELEKKESKFLRWANKKCKKDRRKNYEKRKKLNRARIKIISEGDSWFQYPFFIDEIIDGLLKNYDYAILSLGSGGAWLTTMLNEDEFTKEILKEKPHFLMIGGGGNDILQKGNITKLVAPFDSKLQASDYLTEKFEIVLAIIRRIYVKIISEQTVLFPNVHIFSHGYDYVIPSKRKGPGIWRAALNLILKNGQWLYKPLRKIGIKDSQLQRAIMKELIDCFNEMLQDLENKFDRFHYVDLRNFAKSEDDWFDEIHPDSEKFGEMALRFSEQIEFIWKKINQ